MLVPKAISSAEPGSGVGVSVSGTESLPEITPLLVVVVSKEVSPEKVSSGMPVESGSTEVGIVLTGVVVV